MRKQPFILLLWGAIVCIPSILLGSGQISLAQASGYLHTDGAQILDANGNQVILTGISWFGLETENYAPHGLWARNWESILDQIKELGFNTIRLPYSNQLFDPGSQPNSINEELNPDLKGLSGLDILDKLIQGAGERGLKVILDRHRPGSRAQSELWYTSGYGEERWIQDWVMLAERYRGNDTVIGFDLHNEPHGPATWGSGDPATDWRIAAEKAGNAVLAINPDLLIIVQGIEKYQDSWYWWGGNLIGARQFPIRLDVPNQLVYSSHVYGPGVYAQPWFFEPDFPDNLPGIWDLHWGYLAREGIAPVLVGEFGGRSVGEDREGIWQQTLVSYLREHDISYIYWTINPDSGDTGGLLLDDWQSIDPAKQALLSGYQFSIIGIEQAGTPPASDAARPTAEHTPEQAPPAGLPAPVLRLSYRTANPNGKTQDSKPEFILINSGSSPVSLERIEIRYWFQDDSGQSFSYHCDWARPGCSAVLGSFSKNADGEQYLSLRFLPSVGALAPGENSGEIKIRFNRSDWSAFDQESHYSFAPRSEYDDWEKVTVYFDNQLVWGTEPGGDSAPAAPALAMDATASPPPPAASATLPVEAKPSQAAPAPTATGEAEAASPAPVDGGPALSSPAFLVGMLAGMGLILAVLWFSRSSRHSPEDDS